jgi:hypothetical protein
MSAQPTVQTQAAGAAPAEGDDDRARRRLERQLEILDELAEDGLQWSKAIQRQGLRQAEAAGPDAAPQPCADLGRAYDHVTRAARLALMLQAKLIRDRERLEASDAAAPPMHADRKLGALRVVKRAAQAEYGDREAVERLVREAAERLDREDICADLLSRPAGDIIAFICQDLGLPVDWPSLAQEAWDEAERNAVDPAKKKAEPPQDFTVQWLEPSGPPAPAWPQAASPRSASP